MKKYIKIGIVIPALNEINNTKCLLQSLDEQSHPQFIYKIIIAAGDEDITGYEKLCYEFVNLANKITIIRNIKKITPAALNAGVRECQKNNVDVIQFLGAHSLIRSDFIIKLYTHIQENPGIDIFNSSLSFTQAESFNERAIQLFTYSRLGRNWKSYLSPSEKGFITGIFAVKTGVFNHVGFFDERFIKNQDLHFIKRALDKDFKSKLFIDLVYLYKVRPTIKETLKQMLKTGRYISADLRSANIKHLAPFIFYAMVLTIVSTYLISLERSLLYVMLIIFSGYLAAVLLESFKYLLKKEMSAMLLPFLFIMAHLFYAGGTFYGLLMRIKRNNG